MMVIEIKSDKCFVDDSLILKLLSAKCFRDTANYPYTLSLKAAMVDNPLSSPAVGLGQVKKFLIDM